MFLPLSILNNLIRHVCLSSNKIYDYPTILNECLFQCGHVKRNNDLNYFVIKSYPISFVLFILMNKLLSRQTPELFDPRSALKEEFLFCYEAYGLLEYILENLQRSDLKSSISISISYLYIFLS